MNDAGGNQDVRPAVPIALAPSERGSVFKQRTLALSNFGRKAGGRKVYRAAAEIYTNQSALPHKSRLD